MKICQVSPNSVMLEADGPLNADIGSLLKSLYEAYIANDENQVVKNTNWMVGAVGSAGLFTFYHPIFGDMHFEIAQEQIPMFLREIIDETKFGSGE